MGETTGAFFSSAVEFSLAYHQDHPRYQPFSVYEDYPGNDTWRSKRRGGVSNATSLAGSLAPSMGWNFAGKTQSWQRSHSLLKKGNTSQFYMGYAVHQHAQEKDEITRCGRFAENAMLHSRRQQICIACLCECFITPLPLFINFTRLIHSETRCSTFTCISFRDTGHCTARLAGVR